MKRTPCPQLVLKLSAICLLQACVEGNVMRVLMWSVEKNPDYAREGMRILDPALHDPWSARMRILALQACARMLHTNPACSQYINKESLCQAFECMKKVLERPESSTKTLAQAVLNEINEDDVPFLKERWQPHATPTGQQPYEEEKTTLTEALKIMGINM